MSTSRDPPRNKVARLLEQYDLDGLGEELEARWTASGEQRMSLRDLAAYFNKQLLEAHLHEHEGSGSATDIDTTYRHLTNDEDVSTGAALETRSRLEQAGIDVDTLESAFVSYQAIRSYLTEYRDATYESLSDAEKIEKDNESIQRLLTRTQTVIEDRITQLRESDRIAMEDFNVLLTAQVLCQECGTQYTVDDLLASNGCACQQDSPNQ